MTKNEAASVAQLTDQIKTTWSSRLGYGITRQELEIVVHIIDAVLAQAAPPAAPVQGVTLKDYEEAFADHQRMVRELDVLLNGDGAAKQASLCDIVAQVRNEGIRSEGVSLTEKQQKDLHSHMMAVACRTWDETPSTSIKAHLRAVVKAIAAEPKIRAALLAAPAVPASEPVAWMHTLDNTGGDKENEPIVHFSLHSEHSFGVPGEDFGAEFPITSVPLYATPPAAEDASAQQEMGTAAQVDDKQTMFIVRKPGLVPRLGRPLGDLAASLREWYEGNPGAEIDLLRVWGTSVSTASIEDGREWQSIFDPEAYKAYKTAASAQQDECMRSHPHENMSAACAAKTIEARAMNQAAQQDDRETRAFEDWLARVCPSGDCEAVQRQWEESSDYADLHADQQAQAGGEDKRDAERYRWLRENGNRFFNATHYQGNGVVMDRNVDAALSREQPQGDSNG